MVKVGEPEIGLEGNGGRITRGCGVEALKASQCMAFVQMRIGEAGTDRDRLLIARDGGLVAMQLKLRVPAHHIRGDIVWIQQDGPVGQIDGALWFVGAEHQGGQHHQGAAVPGLPLQYLLVQVPRIGEPQLPMQFHRPLKGLLSARRCRVDGVHGQT